MLGGLWRSEQGFSLMELAIVIIVMGILFSIASSTWLGAVESRKVDSATRQLVADLRQTHTKATNRLTEWRVVLTADSQSYQLVKPAAPAETITLTLPAGTEIGTTKTIAFKGDGSATLVTGSGSTIVVRSADDSPQQHTIQFNTTTSEIKIVP